MCNKHQALLTAEKDLLDELLAEISKATPIIAKPHTLYPIPHTQQYYNLHGQPLGTQKPTVPGVYIEKRLGVAKRIVVR